MQVEPLGHRQRVEADGLRLVVPAVAGQDPGVDRQHLGAQAAHVVGEEVDGALRDRERVLVRLGDEERVRAGRQHPGPGVGRGVVGQLGELLGEELGGALWLAGVGHRRGRGDGELGDVAGVALAARRVRQQLERLLVVLGGLVGTAHGRGLVAGPDGGAQCGVEVVGEAGVPGQLGGRPGCAAVGQRSGVLGVQPDPLAGQQVVVDGLAEQGVPERVAALASDQDVHLDGLAQRLLELAGVEAGRGGEQVVGDLAAGDARDPHRLPGVVVEPVEADQ